MKLTVHTAAIESSDKHIRLYASHSQDEVDADLATYCRENGRDEMPDHAVMIPSDPKEIITAYFDGDATHSEYLTRGEHFLTLPGVLPAVTDRQHATILAALRTYQAAGYANPRLSHPASVTAIATNCGQLEPLDAEEIDALCESLNFPEEPPATPLWDESGEHPDWPLEDWQSDVRAGDTRKGYIQWVNYNLADWEESPATPADEPQPTP